MNRISQTIIILGLSILSSISAYAQIVKPGSSLPVTGITGLGTGVAAALGKNLGTNGSITYNSAAVINVLQYGAKCDGVTDDTTTIQNAINYLASTFNSGVVYIPPDSHCYVPGNGTTPNLVLTQGVSLIGGSQFTSELYAAHTDVPVLTTDTTWTGAEVANLSIYGKGSNNDTTTYGATQNAVTFNSCLNSSVHDLLLIGGYYTLVVNCTDGSFWNITSEGGYGPSNVLGIGASWFKRNKFDVSPPTNVTNATNPMAYPNWVANTAYSVGNVVNNSGPLLIAVANTGDDKSGGSAPTNANFGVAITDNHVTWQLFAPSANYAGLSFQSGVAAATVATGGATCTNGIKTFTVVGGTGTSATVTGTVSGGVLSGNLAATTPGNYTVLPTNPVTLTISGGTCGTAPTATLTEGMALENNLWQTDLSGAGMYNPGLVVNSSGANIEMRGAISSYGITLTQLTWFYLGGSHLGGTIALNETSGTVTIEGNFLNSGNPYGITVAANVSNFALIGNDLNNGPITVASGTSTNYSIIGNRNDTLTDGGTGAVKTIVDQGIETLTGQITTATHYGGAAAGSSLTLASTSNGSPSGDYIALNASNVRIGGGTLSGVLTTLPLNVHVASGQNWLLYSSGSRAVLEAINDSGAGDVGATINASSLIINPATTFSGIINPATSFTPTAGSGATSVAGNDQRFVITSGTAQTSVTANFGHMWTAAPVCTISSNSTASVVDITSTSTTAITLGASVALTGATINVLCFGG